MKTLVFGKDWRTYEIRVHASEEKRVYGEKRRNWEVWREWEAELYNAPFVNCEGRGWWVEEKRFLALYIQNGF